jgi:hypothetical protein
VLVSTISTASATSRNPPAAMDPRCFTLFTATPPLELLGSESKEPALSASPSAAEVGDLEPSRGSVGEVGRERCAIKADACPGLTRTLAVATAAKAHLPRYIEAHR